MIPNPLTIPSNCPTLDPLRVAEHDRIAWQERAIAAEAEVAALSAANDALVRAGESRDRQLAATEAERLDRANECADLRVDNQHLRVVLEAAVMLVTRDMRDGRGFDEALGRLRKVAVDELKRRTAKPASMEEG
jgi:hypothetical protein